MKLRKTLTGKVVLHHECVQCGEGLVNDLDEIGKRDNCPSCSSPFLVPGEHLRAKYQEEKSTRERQKKQEKAARQAQRERAREEKARQEASAAAEAAAENARKQQAETRRQNKLTEMVVSSGDVEGEYEVIRILQ